MMSVAALQQQLAASKKGDVKLRPYFTARCESIGASMISDHERLSLSVTADDSVTTADTSVSLGLIVTALVINALKHAFAHGPSWNLSVGDDGVGMPAEPDSATPGLGTSIVQALAMQLGGVVTVTSAKPGTRDSVEHIYVPVLVGQPGAVRAV
jgi:two-component sensor histidine kinase